MRFLTFIFIASLASFTFSAPVSPDQSPSSEQSERWPVGTTAYIKVNKVHPVRPPDMPLVRPSYFLVIENKKKLTFFWLSARIRETFTATCCSWP
jgi:hypothetical protein